MLASSGSGSGGDCGVKKLAISVSSSLKAKLLHFALCLGISFCVDNERICFYMYRSAVPDFCLSS